MQAKQLVCREVVAVAWRPSAHPGSRRSLPITNVLQRHAHRRAVLVGLPAAATLQLVLAQVPSIAKPLTPAGDWTSPGLAAPEDEAAPRFFKTASGVRVQVLAEGSGAQVQPGDSVLIDYVLRRSNGYFIYGTVEGVSFQPKDVPVGPVLLQLGDGSIVPGLEAALVGLRPGAKLRALVPPEAGYAASGSAAGPAAAPRASSAGTAVVAERAGSRDGLGAGAGALQPRMPTFATQRQLENHKGEPLLFEVQLLRVNGQRE